MTCSACGAPSWAAGSTAIRRCRRRRECGPTGPGRLTVTGNFTDRPVTCPDPGGAVVASTAQPFPARAGEITLAPWQGIITRAAR